MQPGETNKLIITVDWKTILDFPRDDDESNTLDESARIVAHYYEDKLEGFFVERLIVDALGQPAWVGLYQEPMPDRLLAVILKKALLLDETPWSDTL